MLPGTSSIISCSKKCTFDLLELSRVEFLKLLFLGNPNNVYTFSVYRAFYRMTRNTTHTNENHTVFTNWLPSEALRSLRKYMCVYVVVVLVNPWHSTWHSTSTFLLWQHSTSSSFGASNSSCPCVYFS